MTPIPFLLIAEDDVDDRQMLESVLKSDLPDWNYHVCSNGIELLEYLLQKPTFQPSIVLLDINMPKKNGLDTLLEIRRLSRLQQVPVIGYSTSYDKATINRFLELGGNHFLAKPDSFDELKQLAIFLNSCISQPSQSVSSDLKFT